MYQLLPSSFAQRELLQLAMSSVARRSDMRCMFFFIAFADVWNMFFRGAKLGKEIELCKKCVKRILKKNPPIRLHNGSEGDCCFPENNVLGIFSVCFLFSECLAVFAGSHSVGCLELASESRLILISAFVYELVDVFVGSALKCSGEHSEPILR